MALCNRSFWATVGFATVGLLAAVYVSAAPPNPTGTAGPGDKPPAMAVEAAPVQLGTVSQEVTTVGTLRAAESVLIRPEIAGRVAAVHFTEGEPIGKGAELVSLDATEYRAQLAESRAAVRLDTLNFERAEDLHKRRLISQQQYDEAYAKLAASRAQLALDEARLAKTSLRAPFRGILGLRQVSPGAYVQPGQDIVNLEAIDPIKADFRIPETFAAKVRTGQTIELRLDAFPGRTFAGTVYAVDPRIDEQTRTVLLRARIPNQAGELRPGMFARVALVLERREQALLVPEQAIVPQGGDIFVYRVVDGKAAMTKVKLGKRQDGRVEILKGLGAGDLVVTAGQMKIRDGTPVSVIGTQERPRTALAGGD